MKLTGTLAILMLILTLTVPVGTAQGDPIEGSTSLSAQWATINGPDLASSTIFTPWAMTGFDPGLGQFTFGPGALTMVGGSGDFTTMPFDFVTADPLDINNGVGWTFSSLTGDWTTDSFTMDDSQVDDGYIDFFLTGIFAPNPNGALAPFEPSIAEMRISLNRTGSSVSWTSTMNMTPEPATMSLLGLASLALLRRRRRK
ncbi:MAG: PEP-CTERM sorting domain-containing protein [Phycisphaerae bacterium]|nr:PEP-CTERM sorting domain-containing protein [Phycisphaerae bacterium]